MSAQSHYLKGMYRKAALAPARGQDRAFKLAATVFIGQHHEARLLYQQIIDQLDPDHQVLARFHIGLSFVRTSQYKSAKVLFKKNRLALEQKKLSASARWLVYQGMSFYLFFFSQFERSQHYAELGYAELLKMDSPPPLYLSLCLDIQGHNLIQMGQIHRGLKVQEQALKITSQAQLEDWHSELEISHACYRSEFDPHVLEQIQKLTRLLATTPNKNDHSRSELVLQIAKLYLLAGQYQASHQFLGQHYSLIYENENKRKIAKLNTLMAQLMYLRGQNLESLSISRVAKEQLDARTDVALMLPIMGLEAKVQRALGQDSQPMDSRILRRLGEMKRYLNQRIQSRLWPTVFLAQVGEDPLGDLFDQAHKKSPGALEEIIHCQAFGLIPIYYELTPGKKNLVIDELSQNLFSVADDGVIYHGNTITKTQYKILSVIGEQGADKATLIEKIWGYTYAPLRHDPLIYSSITRLRKQLGPRGHWLHADESKYYLAPDTTIVIKAARKKNEANSHSDPQWPQVTGLGELNHRQISYLEQSEPKPVAVSEYAKQWQVTRMTALRDLKFLEAKGLVQRTGRGKATRYWLRG
jgi:hypothetical protein